MTYSYPTRVAMSDGRFVDFPARRRVLGSQYVDADGVVCVRLDFGNGETRTFKVRDDMLLKFAAAGAERALRACAVKKRDPEAVVRAVDERISQLDQGRWG
jgi:hypothetical protein